MNLQDKIKDFPSAPGVYRMKDERGEILYIGKAKDIRKRVQSYWSKAAGERYQIEFLLKKVHDVDCIVTDTEKEALILENTLIKKHKPKYNIDLRDDKSYPSIKLSIKDEYPRIYYTREIKRDGSLYYGPYSSALACKQVVDFIERYFQVRTCSDRELVSRKRPCIQYEIGRCTAPCVAFIDVKNYDEIVRQVRLLLEGKSRELKKEVESMMFEASDQMQFEEAANYRDLLNDLDKTLEQQKMISHSAEERDVIGLYREGESVMVFVMMVREGKVIETRWFPFKKLGDDEDVIESFLVQYYQEQHYVPKEICVPIDLPNKPVVEEHLSDVSGFKVSIYHPKMGDKSKLLELAIRNAEEAFRRRSQKEADREEVLEYVQKRLHLNRLPRRMECFDISNIQGKQAVGSMVCFQDGKPDKSSYRRFKIKTLPEVPNDYAMMYEVLSRRFKRSAKELSRVPGPPCRETGPEPCVGETKWELPDVIVIDGGKGQLNIAKKVLEELDILNVDLCSLAKPQKGESRDKVFIPGRANPIFLQKNSSALHLLMRLRDEAHRFAISYHKSLRHKKLRDSELDEIPGIGKVRKRALLSHFGSLKRLKLASVGDLCQVKGVTKTLAEKIHKAL